MTSNKLPPWDDGKLAEFFASAEYNTRAASLNYPEVFMLLEMTDAALRDMTQLFERPSNEGLLIPRFLGVRARSSFLAAIRLGMSGQAADANAVLRQAIESTWYALHIARDPSPPERSMTWLKRNESEEAKRTCRNEFTVQRVRATHEAMDPSTAKQIHEIYTLTIDFGAHPNEWGVLTSIVRSDETAGFQAAILNPSRRPVLGVLKEAVGVGIGTLKVFRLMFPEGFVIKGLDDKIDTLVRNLNTVFLPYVPGTD